MNAANKQLARKLRPKGERLICPAVHGKVGGEPRPWRTDGCSFPSITAPLSTVNPLLLSESAMQRCLGHSWPHRCTLHCTDTICVDSREWREPLDQAASTRAFTYWKTMAGCRSNAQNCWQNSYSWHQLSAHSESLLLGDLQRLQASLCHFCHVGHFLGSIQVLPTSPPRTLPPGVLTMLGRG